MLKFIVLTIAIGSAAYAAPASPSIAKTETLDESKPLPTPTPAPALEPASASAIPVIPPRSAASAKALTTITEIKTPASTTKLAQLVAPLATPVAAAPILSPLQVSAYAYALPALPQLELAAAPSTYSIEQHGYRIIY
ncbi:PREDICTED: eukaryotic translation initiation factor 3 subunit F-like [Eufriesea mexicana]|uniref:eukaryotic translation initiation factor 3 subunit F-like n=1 Tax=Eufriesea mexicana TaxID=516756 RepID=UPI00083C3899|nr:PREDICTED: eukaryotic translation initiation factor 3 subunit F-like [Eufriesea mexicana]